MFLKTIISIVLFLVSFLPLFLTPTTFAMAAGDVDFRHRNITMPKKTAKYGFMGLGYVTGFTADSIYGLGLDRESQLFQAVETHLKTNNPSILNSPLDLSNQNASINIGFGYKPNNMFRFDGVFTYTQGSAIIIPQAFSVSLTSVNNLGNPMSSTYNFSNIDISTKSISLMFNAYLDSDFSIFRTYIGFGAGPTLLNASIRGNQSFGNGISTDSIRTDQKYDNIALAGNFAVGSHILVSKQIALDLSYRQFFNIASLAKSQNYTNADGSSSSTSSPTKFSIQLISLGVVMYF